MFDNFTLILYSNIDCFIYRSHRLAAQDVGLSRRKHGFDSRWDHQNIFKELADN